MSITKHLAMKTHKRMEVFLHRFLALSLDGHERSLSFTVRPFWSWKRVADIYQTGGYMDPMWGLEASFCICWQLKSVYTCHLLTTKICLYVSSADTWSLFIPVICWQVKFVYTCHLLTTEVCLYLSSADNWSLFIPVICWQLKSVYTCHLQINCSLFTRIPVIYWQL
jgi:hypothetical protein